MLMDVEPKIKSEDSETAEINELAQQIKASHDKLRSGSVPMRSTAVATQMNQVEISEKDTSSLLIDFGWETIPNRPAFPFVRRGSQCFVANQICRKLIVCDVNKKFSLYTTDCLPVNIKNMTKCEADVFNEINIIHCDKSLVGDHYFQEGELMTNLQDVKESFRFFEAFENAMLSMKFENDLVGMEFRDNPQDARELPQSMLDQIIWNYCKKASDRVELVAYKGGHVEVDLFRKLGFTNYKNLEDLKCPKFNALHATPDVWLHPELQLTPPVNCELHVKTSTHKPVHCAAVEVYYFAMWLRSKWPGIVAEFGSIPRPLL